MKLLLAIIMFLSATSGSIEEKFFSSLHSVFGDDVKTEKILVSVNPEIRAEIESASGQRFLKPQIYFWKIFSGGTLKGYAALDNVMGKAQPITFAVYFSADAEILHVEILKYREAYGGQVSNLNWRKQFRNKSAGSSLSLGKDIQSITGATISSRAVTLGVKRMTLLLARMKEEL